MKKAAAPHVEKKPVVVEHEASVQIALRIPERWVEEADELAKSMSKEGMVVTRTTVLRRAMALGLEKLR